MTQILFLQGKWSFVMFWLDFFEIANTEFSPLLSYGSTKGGGRVGIYGCK